MATWEVFGAPVIIAGSVVFLVGAFLPISRVYVTAVGADRQALISARPRMWVWHQAGMGSGAAVTVVGLAMAAAVLEPIGAALLGYAGVAAAAVGTALWVRHVQRRVREPAAFAHGTLPSWPFVTYSFLLQAALAAFGVACILAGLPFWIGAVAAGGALLTFVAFLVFRDVPPFVYYVLTMAVGIGLTGP